MNERKKERNKETKKETKKQRKKEEGRNGRSRKEVRELEKQDRNAINKHLKTHFLNIFGCIYFEAKPELWLRNTPPYQLLGPHEVCSTSLFKHNITNSDRINDKLS